MKTITVSSKGQLVIPKGCASQTQNAQRTMIALDTNILARLLLQDDATQFKRAKALFASGQSFTASVPVSLA